MKKISGQLVKVLREKGWLRTAGFALKAGFAGVFDVIKLRPFASQNAEDKNKVDNFTLECTSPIGMANLSGYQVSNMRIIKDEIKAEPVAGKAGIFFEDEISEVIANSVPFHSKFDDSEGFEFGDKLNIVGASVRKGEDGKPLIPLRRYRYYQNVSNHHQAKMGNKEAYVTRQEFMDYLAGDEEIAGVPADATTMTLAGGNKADDESLWSFTLLVKDEVES